MIRNLGKVFATSRLQCKQNEKKEKKNFDLYKFKVNFTLFFPPHVREKRQIKQRERTSTGWAGIRGTTVQAVVIRQKMRKKFGITFFCLCLGPLT